MPSKHDTMLKLALCIFQLESAKGHLAWKVTDLVRKAGVSRPLVYRYFGSSKKNILLEALRVFIDDHYGFSKNEAGVAFPERLRRARERMIAYPEAVVFYQKWRSKDSWLKDEFIKVEKKFQRQLAKRYPGIRDDQVVMTHAFIHGVVTAPFMTADEAFRACEEFERNYLDAH